MPKPQDELAPDGALVIAETEQANEDEENAGFDAAADVDVKAAEPKPSKEQEPEAKPDPKPDSAPKPDATPEKKTDDAPKPPETAAGKAEAAAKILDGSPAGTPPSERKDVFDGLPAEYQTLKADRENGKLAEFLKTQPKSVQRLATESDDPDDAKYVLDLYRASVKPAEAKPTPEAKEAAKEVKAFVKKFGDRQFVGADGQTKKLSDLMESYGDPDLFEGLAAIAEAIADERRQPAAPEAKHSDAASETRLATIEARLAEQAFWEPVLEAHPDAKALKRSGKLAEWVKTQSAGINRLAASGEPEHAVLVLDAYKEAMAKSAKAGGDKTARDRKKDIDGLHGETARGGRDVRAPKAGEGKTAEEEQADGFEEGAKA